MTVLSHRAGALTNRQLQENLVSLAIVYRPIERLQLSADNPRFHNKKQISQIARSLKTFGFLVPVLVDGALRVIAGHGRVQAAKLLGMRNLPTVSIEHLTEHQIKAFRIADNKLATNSEWDEKLLGEQLKVLSAVELKFDLETVGFEMGEIDLLIENVQPDTENDSVADALPEAEPGVRVTVRGDLWTLGRNRIFCGDSFDSSSYVKIMEGRKAKMVFTDPPYTVPPSAHTIELASNHRKNPQMAVGELNETELTSFLMQVFSLLVSQTSEGSIHLVFADWHYMTEVLTAGKKTFGELNNLCFWVKDKVGMGTLYRGQHELVFVFKAGKDRQQGDFQPSLRGHYPGSMFRAQATGAGNIVLRPTAKPVPLMADAIVDCSARGDIVLDPFLGTGAAVIAAERTGRICYGIEVDPNAVDTIIRRWQTFTRLSARHATSGKTFREREKEVAGEFRH